MNKEEQFSETSNETHEKVRLSRHIRLFIFFIFWILHFLNCSDSGIPTASSNNIKKVLKFTDSQFGNYGSLVQLGRLTGTVIGLNILNICNRKILIIFAPFIKSLTLLVYYYTDNFWIIMTCRYIQGFVHVSTYIYFPTWIEQFGLQKYKGLMINSIQTASPFGSVFGFALCTFMGTDNWKKCFSLLAYSIMFLICVLFFIPEKYFSSQIYFSRHIEISQNEDEEHIEGRGSIYSLFEKNESHIKEKNPTENIWCEVLNAIFLSIVLARAVILFIFMVVHYWIGDYFINVLDVENKLAKTLSYSIISLVGPFVGTIIGRYTIEYIGGYEQKKATLLCIFYSILTCISGSFVSKANSLLSFTFILFLFFVFANCQIPILIGISINNVPQKFKAMSYSVNNLICTFFGYLLAPAIYGYINDYYKLRDKKMALRFAFYYVWGNLFYLLICGIIQFLTREEDEDEEEK